MRILRAQIKKATNQLVRKKHPKRASFDGAGAIAVRLLAMKVQFREEYEFAPPRKYRADFAVLNSTGEIALLIEYDGATHVKGGHSSGEGITRDAMKANLAIVLGYKYVRFTVDLLRRPGYFEDVILSITNANEE